MVHIGLRLRIESERKQESQKGIGWPRRRGFLFLSENVEGAGGTTTVLMFHSPKINLVCASNSNKTKIYSERRFSKNSNRTENTQSRKVNSLQTQYLRFSKRDWNAVFSPLLREPVASPRSVPSNRQNLKRQELESLVTSTKQSQRTLLIANFGNLFSSSRSLSGFFPATPQSRIIAHSSAGHSLALSLPAAAGSFEGTLATRH